MMKPIFPQSLWLLVLVCTALVAACGARAATPVAPPTAIPQPAATVVATPPASATIEPGATATVVERVTATATPVPPAPLLLVARESTLWAMLPDGAAQAFVTAEGGLVASPAIAPDGRHVAYVANYRRDGSIAIYSQLMLVDRSGGEPRLLWQPGQGVIGRLAWAADGSAIYAGIDGLRTAGAALGGARLQEIMRIDVASGEAGPVFEDALDPAMAPDGRSIAYLRAADSATDERAPIAALELAPLDGSAGQVLVDGAQFEGMAAPRFSPDGRSIVFAAAGGPAAGLLPSLLALLGPATAHAHGDITYDLWQVGIDGSQLRRIAVLAEDDPVAVYGPDGSLLVLAAGGFYGIDPATGTAERLAGEGSHGGIDAWP